VVWRWIMRLGGIVACRGCGLIGCLSVYLAGNSKGRDRDEWPIPTFSVVAGTTSTKRDPPVSAWVKGSADVCMYRWACGFYIRNLVRRHGLS
jgi:hypothetical protein